MITTKQRAFLRSLGTTLGPVMQIGKEGLKDSSIEQIEGLFQARELIKIKVLQNCDFSPKQLADEIQQATNCEQVQVIGGKIVLYRRSTKKGVKHIQIP